MGEQVAAGLKINNTDLYRLSYRMADVACSRWESTCLASRDDELQPNIREVLLAICHCAVIRVETVHSSSNAVKDLSTCTLKTAYRK